MLFTKVTKNIIVGADAHIGPDSDISQGADVGIGPYGASLNNNLHDKPAVYG